MFTDYFSHPPNRGFRSKVRFGMRLYQTGEDGVKAFFNARITSRAGIHESLDKLLNWPTFTLKSDRDAMRSSSSLVAVDALCGRGAVCSVSLSYTTFRTRSLLPSGRSLQQTKHASKSLSRQHKNKIKMARNIVKQTLLNRAG